MASPNTKYNKDCTILNELYETPEESLELLYNYVTFSKKEKILEPCDGLGKISDFFIKKGHKVISNELYREVYGSSATHGEDFLNTDLFNNSKQGLYKFDCVVMNPPFKLSLEFVNKALIIAPRVLVFCRASFLEGQKRYNELFSSGKLHNIYMHTKRVGCRKGIKKEDGDIDFEPAVNAVSYCWYEFKEQVTVPKFHWLV